jgi:hypothetical protein
MTQEQFKSIIGTYIVPMFVGATVEDGGAAPRQRQQRRLAYLRDAQKMFVRSSGDAVYQLKIKRSQYFQREDAAFVESLLKKIERLDKKINGSPFFDDLIKPVIRRTVSEQLSASAAELIYRILIQYESWSEQTYEGRRIAAAVGVDPTALGGSGVPLMEIYGEKFGLVLANGLDSFLTVAGNGDIIAYEPFPLTPMSTEYYAPLRFTWLAEWSTGGKISLGLNRNGEILLFKDCMLVFAKRRGRWLHFTHNAVIKRATLRGAFESELCSAVYQTCLDVSFARTGGCIAIARRTRKDQLLNDNIIDTGDKVNSDNLKSKCLRTIAGMPFQKIDRRLRQNVVAMDGATVLDYKGNFIAGGAIVKVPPGSDEGGRLAATKALSEYGLAVKISSDGEIRGFSVENGNVQELLSVG